MSKLVASYLELEVKCDEPGCGWKAVGATHPGADSAGFAGSRPRRDLISRGEGK